MNKIKEKSDKKYARRLRYLLFIVFITAVIITAATYAWFIGLRSVNISTFDVTIASTDTLLLSLDGVTWESEIVINEGNYQTVNTSNNTNSWGGTGLTPVSTIGEIDTNISRLKMFEKSSITATPGGYRIMASRLDNSDTLLPEPNGYVVFDLFIKNFSGTAYYKELNQLNEEGIYLTVDSEVTVSQTGGIPNTGIENLARVGFAQIGRVVGTEDTQATITGITCSDNEDVTGICRTASIWEPNDTRHVPGAIGYYTTSCRRRVGYYITQFASYSGNCKQVVDGIAYPTYGIRSEIKSSHNVDIYDGFAYNSYTSTTQLQEIPNYTDSQKNIYGVDRGELFSLAPNSITKVRVYVWLEGQDIDSYSFAAIGKAITVNFGFTKERLIEEDIDYDGPDVNQGYGPNGEDRTAPVITLLGDNPVRLAVGEEYIEPGATAVDNIDGVLDPLNIEVTGAVSIETAGSYTLLYKIRDAAGNLGTKTRTIIVE